MIDLERVAELRSAAVARCQERLARATLPGTPAPIPAFGVTSCFKSRHGL